MPNQAMQRSWPQVFGCSEFVLVGSEVSTMDDAELPLADPEIEEQVRTMVGGGLSPEEYAARWATRSLASGWTTTATEIRRTGSKPK